MCLLLHLHSKFQRKLQRKERFSGRKCLHAMTCRIPAGTSIYCTAGRRTPSRALFFSGVNRAERLKLRHCVEIGIEMLMHREFPLYSPWSYEKLSAVWCGNKHAPVRSARTLGACALARAVKGPFDRRWASDKMAALFAYGRLNKQQTRSELQRRNIRTQCVCSSAPAKHLQAAARS